MRTLILSLIVGTGVTIGAVNALPNVGSRTTIPLPEKESEVVFLHIEGDYRAMAPEKMADLLTTAHELVLLGDSLRSDTDSNKRIWAVVSKDSSTKIAKSLSRDLKKLEFEVESVNITVLSPLSSAKDREVRSAARAVERDDNKIPVVYQDRKTRQVWVFHEPKLKSKKVEKVFRETEIIFDFYHQEFDLTPGEKAKATADLEVLKGSAGEKLDLVRSSRREDALILDVYMRDMESFQLLEKSKRYYMCPSLAQPLLGDALAGVEWSVTLSNDGFPFVGD